MTVLVSRRFWRRRCLEVAWLCLFAQIGLLSLRGAEPVRPDEEVQITAMEQGGSVRLVGRVKDCIDVTITLELELQNMASAQKSPITVDSNGRRYFEIATFRQVNKLEPFKYTWKYTYLRGGRQGRHDPNAVYRLPFQSEGKCRLVQGHHGRFTHGPGSGSEHALDWEMPEGSIVLAAREGRVVGLRQGPATGESFLALSSKGNYVLVRHSDNTYAEYMHLQEKSAFVKIGDSVKAGQPIARSGDSGKSGVPHLHFAVFKTLDGLKRETYPVVFQLADGRVTDRLVEGDSY